MFSRKAGGKALALIVSLIIISMVLPVASRLQTYFSKGYTCNPSSVKYSKTFPPTTKCFKASNIATLSVETSISLIKAFSTLRKALSISVIASAPASS